MTASDEETYGILRSGNTEDTQAWETIPVNNGSGGLLAVGAIRLENVLLMNPSRKSGPEDKRQLKTGTYTPNLIPLLRALARWRSLTELFFQFEVLYIERRGVSESKFRSQWR